MKRLIKHIALRVQRNPKSYMTMVLTAVVSVLVVLYAFSEVINHAHIIRWHNQADYAYMAFTETPGQTNSYIDLNYRLIKINGETVNADLYMEMDQKYEESPFLLNDTYETANRPSDTPFVLMTRNTSRKYGLSLGETVKFEDKNYVISDFLPYSEGFEDRGFRDGLMVFSHDPEVSNAEANYLVFSKGVDNSMIEARMSYSQSEYLSEYETLLTIYLIGGTIFLAVFIGIVENRYLSRTDQCHFLKHHGLSDRRLSLRLLKHFLRDYIVLLIVPLGLIFYRFDPIVHSIFYGGYYFIILSIFAIMIAVYRIKVKEVYPFGKSN